MGGGQFPVVKRKPAGEGRYAAADGGEGVVGLGIADDHGDEFGDFAHLLFAEAAGGEGGSAKADARGVQRRVDVERDGILIHGDVGEVEGLFRFFAANAAGEDVNQNDVAVGAA